MICPYCGKDNPDEPAICYFCGAPLTVAEDQAGADENFLEPKVTIVNPPEPIEEIPPAYTSASPQPEVLAPTYQQPVTQPPKRSGGNRIWWLVGCIVIVLLFLCCGISIVVFYNFANTIRSGAIPQLNSPITINLAPTQAPAANANTLFFDDFSDPSSGWDTVDNSNYYADYYENAYRITVNTDLSDSWANPGSNVFGDVHIEAQATKNGGPDYNDFGLICRYQDADRFYYAVISSDGYFGILKVTPDSTTQLGYSDLQASTSINTGETSNQIRLDCVGDQLSLYVNGQLLETEMDSSYTEGNVGLIAGTYDDPGTDILFDNFTVLKP